MVVGPAVDHRWFLCDAQTMDQIDELDVHSKQMQLQLDSWGTVSGWCDLLDMKSANILEHQTAIRCDRNNKTIWSGPIWKTTKTASTSTGTSSGNAQLQFTAMGWLYTLQRRLLHTGAEFQAMMIDPGTGLDTANYAAWVAANGSSPYASLGVDEATTLAYSATVLPGTTDAAIIFDLLDRANIDAPTHISRGSIFGSPVQRNLTLQRFQKVGDQIIQLVNVEAGCDIYVDPVTRQLNLYGPGASSSSMIANGLGNDSTDSIFSFPGNSTSAEEDRDGTVTANRIEAVGQYGVGRADDPTSQSVNGLLEDTDSLSDVVDINILIAYANVEVSVRAYPWTTITFTPRSVAPDDVIAGSASGVPRPFDDFNIGDLVGSRVDYGSFQVGVPAAPQPTRIFGFTLNVDDGGIEKLSSISTTYQGLTA